jgi:hypothetical protein
MCEGEKLYIPHKWTSYTCNPTVTNLLCLSRGSLFHGFEEWKLQISVSKAGKFIERERAESRAPTAEGSHNWVAVAGFCLVLYIAAREEIADQDTYPDCFLGLSSHLHALCMYFLPYQVSDHASDKG